MEDCGWVGGEKRGRGGGEGYSRNSQEWNAFKFVFKAYVGVVAPPILTAVDRAEPMTGSLLVRAEQPVTGANRIAAMQSILQYRDWLGQEQEQGSRQE